MRFLSFLLSLAILTACASTPQNVQVPTAKEFNVPSDLANKFEVREHSAPTPASEPVPAEPVVKGKKAKKKEAKIEAPKPETIPNRWTMPSFFKVGERYFFDITYFGATAGNLEMQLMPEKVINNRPTFHIRALATTSSVFSLFYRVHDVAESFMDTTGLFSHKFSLKLDESMQQREVLELYDQKKHTAYYWSKLDHKKKGKINQQFEIATEPFTQDGISAFYYVRTLPLEIGKSYTFPVVNNGKLRHVRVTAMRKEMLVTKIGELPTIVVKPEVALDGVLSTYGDSFMWISDDDRRLLLKIDAKIKVGSIIAYLREFGYDGKPDTAAQR